MARFFKLGRGWEYLTVHKVNKSLSHSVCTWFVLAIGNPCKRAPIQIFQERHTFNIPLYLLFPSFSYGAPTLPKWKQSGIAGLLKKKNPSLLSEKVVIVKFRKHWANNKQTKPNPTKRRPPRVSFSWFCWELSVLSEVFGSKYLMESLETFYYMNPSNSGL